MKITIKTFAAAKEYFSSTFEFESMSISTVGDLKQELTRIKPESKNILAVSRFAVNDVFVNESTPLDEHAIIFIIPPSSGG